MYSVIWGFVISSVIAIVGFRLEWRLIQIRNNLHELVDILRPLEEGNNEITGA